MALHRRAAKRDSVEASIVGALLKTGWSVLKVSVKDGPDLVVCRFEKSYSRTVYVECKTGKKKLKPGQEHWANTWPGETRTIRSAEEALNL